MCLATSPSHPNMNAKGDGNGLVVDWDGVVEGYGLKETVSNG